MRPGHNVPMILGSCADKRLQKIHWRNNQGGLDDVSASQGSRRRCLALLSIKVVVWASGGTLLVDCCNVTEDLSVRRRS